MTPYRALQYLTVGLGLVRPRAARKVWFLFRRGLGGGMGKISLVLPLPRQTWKACGFVPVFFCPKPGALWAPSLEIPLPVFIGVSDCIMWHEGFSGALELRIQSHMPQGSSC